MARWLAIKPRVILLDLTRGVDIGAESEIYRIISDLAAQGIAVLMVSSIPEIVGMRDRVLVIREGRLVGELAGGPSKEITQENIMAYATKALEVAAS